MTSNHDSRMTTGHPHGTDQTAGEDFAMSSTHDDWQRHDAPPTQADSPTRDAEPTLSRPKGPSWSTVALGLVCLLVAGGALWVEWADVSLDWTRSGPLAVVGVGLVLVLVGLAALLRRNDDDEER